MFAVAYTEKKRNLLIPFERTTDKPEITELMQEHDMELFELESTGQVNCFGIKGNDWVLKSIAGSPSLKVINLFAN